LFLASANSGPERASQRSALSGFFRIDSPRGAALAGPQSAIPHALHTDQQLQAEYG